MGVPYQCHLFTELANAKCLTLRCRISQSWILKPYLPVLIHAWVDGVPDLSEYVLRAFVLFTSVLVYLYFTANI